MTLDKQAHFFAGAAIAAYIIIPEAAIPKALLRTPSQRRTDAL